MMNFYVFAGTAKKGHENHILVFTYLAESAQEAAQMALAELLRRFPGYSYDVPPIEFIEPMSPDLIAQIYRQVVLDSGNEDTNNDRPSSDTAEPQQTTPEETIESQRILIETLSAQVDRLSEENRQLRDRCDELWQEWQNAIEVR